MTLRPARSRAGRETFHRFVTRDQREAVEHFAACEVGLSINPLRETTGCIEISAVNRCADGLVFIRSAFEDPVEIRPRPNAWGYQILLALKGTTSVDLGDQVIHCEGLRAAIFDPGQARALRRSAFSENYSIFIDRNLLTNRLFELTGAPVIRQLSFEPEFDLERPSIQCFRQFLAGLDLPMLAALRDAPHSVRRLSALLVDLVLELLPHNHSKVLEGGAQVIAPKHVKRTVDYLRSNASKPIMPEELAAMAGVSLRALQYGFQKFIGVSISEFERSVRLDGVRREIEGCPGERVGDIARRWRFSNFTRFNAQFEAAFGLSAVAFRAQIAQLPQPRELVG